MRSALLVMAALACAEPALAAPAPAPPKVFAAAGYAEPDIPPSACRALNASEVQCVIPAMTAGRYFARAAGASTASAAGAVQQITIAAGEESCVSTRNPDPKAPWAVGTRRVFYAGCLFTVVSDTPVTVTAVYLDAKAVKDPKGPSLTVTPAPWAGVLGALPVKMRQ